MSASVYTCLSVGVCLFVCQRAYIPNHTGDLYQFFAHVDYDSGSVFLQRGDAIPRGNGNFGGFLPIDIALRGP